MLWDSVCHYTAPCKKQLHTWDKNRPVLFKNMAAGKCPLKVAKQDVHKRIIRETLKRMLGEQVSA
jgi:hypothetical protein